MKKAPWLTLILVLTVFLTIPAAVNAGTPIGNRFVIYNDASVSETEAAVAYNSLRDEYLVVWTAESAGPIKEIWGRRVARDGTLLGSAFRISPANDGYHPDVAYNSQANQYLVVWETGQSIRGQRLSATGSLQDSVINIVTGYVHGAYHYTQPAVDYAYTSDRYLVAFRYIWDLDGSSSIQARAYLGSGTPEDYAFEVSSYSVTLLPENPDLAYNRSRDEFLVVWQQTWGPDDRDIHARRVTMAGGASAHPDGTFAITTSTNDDVTPAVAAIATVPNAGQYLVAWESDPDLSTRDVRARTVAGTGTLGALRTLADTGWSEHSPAVAGCEACQQFLAVWVWIPVVTPPPMMQVQARTLDLNGNALGSTTTVVGGQVFETAVAAGLVDNFLIALDDNEVIGISNRGIYGQLWGSPVYQIHLPLVLRDY